METRINIAEILRNKPHGVKLYSPIFGDCTYCYVREDTNDICVKRPYNVMSFFNFEGLYNTAGECLLFPSKKMRNWSKFAWKKGDALSCGVDNLCIFEKWANKEYTEFYAKFVTPNYSGNTFKTEKWSKETNEAVIKQYISNIEEFKGGKLNLTTLEIEKTQPEFKDGDIVFVESHMLGINTSSIITAIFRKEKENDKYKFSPALCESNVHDTYLRESPVVLSPSDIKTFRLATEEEKKQFFSALANKGKAWDSDKKSIVDLKPKFDELKPFDKVIVRCSKADKWSIDFFSYKVSNGYICTGDAWFGYCLPYNEETAKLVGTTNNMEG